MRFASVVEMEPGHWFRAHAGGKPLEWLGVEPVISRFVDKERVRVLCAPGPPFVVDRDRRFPLIDWRGGR